MKQELAKVYNPADNEDKIYQKWEESGYFNPDNLDLPKNAKSYTIVLPPPNITDKLHMGHVANLAIEDLLIRYYRLSGFRTLWLPGTDHAAIATQNVVEKKILKESGKTRHDLGREKFLTEVWSFLKDTQATILHQIKKMGASLDWSRLAFTLDSDRQLAVQTMFKEMYDEGVIYRGERIVNWCPRCHSTLADDEVEYKEEKAKLYWIKYGPFILATSRPETKLGDTAVAVHPDDPRYQHLVGQELDIEGVLGKFKVKVVADKEVDINFGSGAIKVTPAHSFIDNEIAKRHNLPSKKIINEDGRMMANCGKYAGLTTREAREAIVADMQTMELIDHIDEDYLHNTAVCYRCGTVIEPLPSKQWFISVDQKIKRLGDKSLKEKALAAAQEAKIKFIPERFNKRYGDWMNNLHDWCISRQIWFGHQIPVWYKGEEIYVGLEAPAEKGWERDPDTLDTWFSSGMWTFSTLGWPKNYPAGEKNGDLAKFHPTQVLETGYELITLWVSRMVMMSFFALGEIPFEKVYLHGMILDKAGKKMAKSKGNGVDPLDMKAKYGADATRLSILTGSTPGNDSRFSEDKVEAKRNFINKLWNISRFILTGAEEKFFSTPADKVPIGKTLADQWILTELAILIKTITERLNNFDFSAAAEDLEKFTGDKLADWYLEIAKVEKNKEEILIYLLKNILILWHPLAPFVTETIWASFNDSILMVANWPTSPETKKSTGEEIKLIQDIIVAIRNARSENKIEPAKKLTAVIYGQEAVKLLETQAEVIKSLRTGLEKIEIKAQGEKISNAIMIPVGEIEIYLLGAVDEVKEKARLLKEQANLEKLVNLQEQKLQNKEFTAKAPEKIVLAEKEKLANYQQELTKIVKIIQSL
ncbi:MAG: valine--tRNA ligase [Patescibacteria group bacterium]